MLRRLGKFEAALKRYEQILSAQADSVVAWRGIAEVVHEANRPCESYPALVARDDPALRLHQGVACAGDSTVAAQQRRSDVREWVSKRDSLAGDEHLLDFAKAWLYVLKQPDRALKLARKNWETQKSADDALVLIDAAAQSGDWSGVEKVVTYLKQNGIEDHRIDKVINQTQGQG